jgi:hypothetical protein
MNDITLHRTRCLILVSHVQVSLVEQMNRSRLRPQRASGRLLAEVRGMSAAGRRYLRCYFQPYAHHPRAQQSRRTAETVSYGTASPTGISVTNEHQAVSTDTGGDCLRRYNLSRHQKEQLQGDSHGPSPIRVDF